MSDSHVGAQQEGSESDGMDSSRLNWGDGYEITQLYHSLAGVQNAETRCGNSQPSSAHNLLCASGKTT